MFRCGAFPDSAAELAPTMPMQLQCNKTKCPVLQNVSETRTELTKLFQTVQNHEPLASFFSDNRFFTWEHFLSNFITVSSRSFHINITKTHGLSLLKVADKSAALGKQISFMAPFADFLNHHNSFPAIQSGYTVNDRAKTFEVVADQDYRRGDQV